MTWRNHSSLDAVWRELYIDKNDNLPPVKQIANAIRHKIATSRIRSGETLPSVRSLAHLLDVTPATVARAYGKLQEEGLVQARKGAGTVVMDVANIDEAAQQRNLDSLNEVLDGAVLSLRRLGFTIPEIREAIHRKLSELPLTRRVLFVAGAKPVAAKYKSLLEQHLAQFGVEVVSTTIDEIAVPDEILTQILTSVERVVTLLSFQRDVRDALDKFKLPISVLLTEVTLATLTELEAIPRQHQVLLVAEEAYRTTGIGMLRPYCSDEQLLVARDLDVAAVRRTAARADTIVHTLGTSDIVREVIKPDQKAIELEYQPRSDSLERIMTVLGNA